MASIKESDSAQKSGVVEGKALKSGQKKQTKKTSHEGQGGKNLKKSKSLMRGLVATSFAFSIHDCE